MAAGEVQRLAAASIRAVGLSPNAAGARVQRLIDRGIVTGLSRLRARVASADHLDSLLYRLRDEGRVCQTGSRSHHGQHSVLHRNGWASYSPVGDDLG